MLVDRHKVIGLSARFRKARNSSNDFQVLKFSNLQYCLDLTSHKYSPSSTNRASRSCSLVFSQVKISSILPRTKTPRRRFNSGATAARPLIHKLVKPIKIARSCLAHEIRVD